MASNPFNISGFLSSYPKLVGEGFQGLVVNPITSLYNSAAGLIKNITSPPKAPATVAMGTLPKAITQSNELIGPTLPKNTIIQQPQNTPPQGYGATMQQDVNTPSFTQPSFADQVKQALDITRQANQPAIQALQASIDPLKQRYSDLINSINTQGTVAANKQTTITNNELGARGILGNSTLAQQEIQNATLPVQAQFSGLAANAGLAEQQDINNINNQIASLQAGNPQGAMQAGLQQQSYALQAQQLAAQIANQQAQQAIARGQLGISGGNLALQQALSGYDPATGKIINPLAALSQSSGANNAGGLNSFIYNQQ